MTPPLANDRSRSLDCLLTSSKCLEASVYAGSSPPLTAIARWLLLVAFQVRRLALSATYRPTVSSSTPDWNVRCVDILPVLTFRELPRWILDFATGLALPGDADHIIHLSYRRTALLLAVGG